VSINFSSENDQYRRNAAICRGKRAARCLRTVRALKTFQISRKNTNRVDVIYVFTVRPLLFVFGWFSSAAITGEVSTVTSAVSRVYANETNERRFYVRSTIRCSPYVRTRPSERSPHGACDYSSRCYSARIITTRANADRPTYFLTNRYDRRD